MRERGGGAPPSPPRHGGRSALSHPRRRESESSARRAAAAEGPEPGEPPRPLRDDLCSRGTPLRGCPLSFVSRRGPAGRRGVGPLSQPLPCAGGSGPPLPRDFHFTSGGETWAPVPPEGRGRDRPGESPGSWAEPAGVPKPVRAPDGGDRVRRARQLQGPGGGRTLEVSSLGTRAEGAGGARASWEVGSAGPHPGPRAERSGMAEEPRASQGFPGRRVRRGRRDAPLPGAGARRLGLLGAQVRAAEARGPHARVSGPPASVSPDLDLRTGPSCPSPGRPGPRRREANGGEREAAPAGTGCFPDRTSCVAGGWGCLLPVRAPEAAGLTSPRRPRHGRSCALSGQARAAELAGSVPAKRRRPPAAGSLRSSREVCTRRGVRS